MSGLQPSYNQGSMDVLVWLLFEATDSDIYWRTATGGEGYIGCLVLNKDKHLLMKGRRTPNGILFDLID